VVTRLHDEVYARLPHGRLVLIGRPGAGKTGAMILLLLAALDRRGSLGADQRARVPVPVWLTLGGWNPAATPLREWAAGMMNRDYPALRAPDYGSEAAGQLVRSGRVALFLDGLDEMPAGMRPLALKRIVEETRDLRVVITSRRPEYRRAVQAVRPENTAVIELRPVRPETAAAYLLHGQDGDSRQRWQQVGAYLRSNPASAAARALNNPLTLSLARDAYTTGDPVVLTDPGRFSTTDAISEHLIDQFLVTAYPSEDERAHAVRWLAWIASHMGASPDLQWWDIPRWVPRWKLRLARGLTTGLATGLLVTIAAWLTYGHTRGLTAAFAGGLKFGIAAGTGSGLIAGLVTRLTARPPATAGMRVPLVKRWTVRAALAGLAVSLALSAFAGIYSGFVLFAGTVLYTAPLFAYVAVLSVPLVRRLTRRAVPSARVPLLERPLARMISAGLALGSAVGLGAWLIAGPGAGIRGGISGFATGIPYGIALSLWGKRGFGLAGAPQALTPRWPRRPWLAPLWLPLFPLLMPLLLNNWAVPIADSPSATALGSYLADRRTSAIYASAYALALGTATGLVAGLAARLFGNDEVTGQLALGFGWGLVAGISIWITAWLTAGQVPLVNLTQLVLNPQRTGRVHFAQILEDAFDRQVMRQAGVVYQFRHAALQAHLARMHANPPPDGQRKNH
jgi:hypothetical protein